MKAEEFQVWKLKADIERRTGTLTCEDGNYNKVFEKALEFTDFPLPEITLWFSPTIPSFCRANTEGRYHEHAQIHRDEGKHHLWRDIVKLREQQCRLAAAAVPKQQPLFEMHEDFRAIESRRGTVLLVSFLPLFQPTGAKP